MTWSYDPTTDVGKVRLRIADTNAASPVMQDEDIEAFLDMAGDAIPLAAAMALESIAMNELLCLKVVNLMGALVTDAASAAKQMREIAGPGSIESTAPTEGLIAGLIYYNKDDPAVWVEKRVGVGWTLNFAQPTSCIMMILLIVVSIAAMVMGLAGAGGK